MAKAQSKVTTEHEEIRRWAEERGARPARVRGTGGDGDVGIIRLEFPGAPNSEDESLEPISWEDWFRKFDESGLALLYQDTLASGEKSNFNKLISRETAAAMQEEQPRASRRPATASAGSKGKSSKAQSARSSSSKRSAAKSGKRAVRAKSNVVSLKTGQGSKATSSAKRKTTAKRSATSRKHAA